jgi:arylsulfatase A-like enzyme
MDISALLTGEAKSVRDEFLYYTSRGQIDGIRQGDWKLLVKFPERDRKPDNPAKPEVLLFNLAEDLGERRNLAAEKPELVARLRQRLLTLDAAIEAGARPTWKKQGS